MADVTAEPMNRNTWQGHLQRAHTVHGVLGVVRDYLALLHYFEIQSLPTAYRPRDKFVSSIELAEYAYELARRDAGAGDPREALLDRLSAFFSGASQRCAQIEAMAGIRTPSSRTSSEAA
jgi:hypothetical protein